MQKRQIKIHYHTTFRLKTNVFFMHRRKNYDFSNYDSSMLSEHTGKRSKDMERFNKTAVRNQFKIGASIECSMSKKKQLKRKLKIIRRPDCSVRVKFIPRVMGVNCLCSVCSIRVKIFTIIRREVYTYANSIS